MSQNKKILEHIDNIEQDFKMLDNIFKCINVYWKGEGARAIQDTYKDIQKDIAYVRNNMLKLKETLE